MDKVRLGRALGYGARHAAKTVAAVAEAATAPDPRQAGAAGSAEMPRPTARADEGPRSVRPEGKVSKARTAQVHSAGRAAGRSMWGPLATFSSALWLRVTGCFFGLVAWAMLTGAWRQRGALQTRAGDVEGRHFWVFLGFGLLFAYFAVSGFARASLRERRGRG